MKSIELNAYAKINLSIDILGVLPDGYHEISTIMQMIELHDKVRVRWIPGSRQPEGKHNIEIELSSNKRFLPVDERNLAYKAAALMASRFSAESLARGGQIRIDIKKQIPVGAGLAGGSADCAAVLHAISKLWHLNLSVSELCELGGALGADVPFCIMGQAGANREDPKCQSGDALQTGTCAHATGIGTKLTPIAGINCWLVLSKPPISVSTAKVYRGFDEFQGQAYERPDTDELVFALKARNFSQISKNMVNVLENYTLKAYPSIVYTKNIMEANTKPIKALMSGSGPTIFALYKNRGDARSAFEKMKLVNRETFLTKTIF